MEGYSKRNTRYNAGISYTAVSVWSRYLLTVVLHWFLVLHTVGGSDKPGQQQKQQSQQQQHQQTDLLIQILVNHTNSTHAVRRCPQQLDVTLQLPELPVQIALTLSEHFEYSKIPVYTDDGRGHRWKQVHTHETLKEEQICFYKDLSYDAGFSIRIENDSYKLRGVFHTNTTSYTVEPSREVSTAASGLHYLTTRPNHDSYSLHNRLKSRWRRQAKTNYVVELLAVVDFPIYKRWFTLSGAGQVTERDQSAVEMIKYYYSHLVHEVDLRYKSIVTSDYTMGVVLSGLYIAKSTSSLTWEENLKETRTNERPAIRAGLVLEAMGPWVTQITNNSHKLYDHAMLFTGYDIYDISNSVKIYNKIGSAYLEGICLPRSRVSVVEDNSDFTASLTAAHELGHSLGAQHDGDGNICNSNDQFVMASTVESRTDSNIFRFSYCSINAFRSWALTLNRASANCLTNTATGFNQSDIDSHLKTPPGQRFTLSTQCKIIYGEDSYFCGGEDNVGEICKKLVCYKPSEDACFILGGRPAFRGTTCGNRKWCVDNTCVADSNAPPRPENCTFGDTLTGVLVSGEKLSCEQVIQQHPYLCYDKDLRDLCCGSCQAIREEERPWCEYGDRTSGCEGISKEVCKREYDLCCGSCKHYETGIPGCRFGDGRSWCGSLSAHQCYLPDGALCCQTCHNYRTNIADCEFGDKIQGCNKGLCIDSYYKRNCCYTCRDPTTPATSTTTSTVAPSSVGVRTTTRPTWFYPTTKPREIVFTTPTSQPTKTTTSSSRDILKTGGAQGVKSSGFFFNIVIFCMVVLQAYFQL